MALTAPTANAIAILTREEETRKINVNEITTDMKNSEFFRQNWDSLLLAAPNCLEILGNINLVAATPWAEVTRLKGPFKYLTHADFLRGALACISSQAGRSFGVARTNMTKIQYNSGSVNEQVRVIYKALGTPNAPMASVMARLEQLKETANDCHRSAQEIEESMNLWAEFVAELYEVCHNTSASVEDRKRSTDQQIELAKEDEKFRIQQETTAKKELEKMDTALTDAKNAYKSALDSMPTGMELVGGAILMGLAESAGTALNTYAACSNPIGGVGTASKGLSELVKDLKNDTKNDQSATKTSGPSTAPAKAETKGATSLDESTPQKKAADKKASILTTKLASVFIRRAKPKAAGTSATGESKEGEKANQSSTTEQIKADENPSQGKTASYGEYDLSGKFVTDDPALTQTPAALASVEILKNIIVGLPDGIKWDSVISKDASKPSELATVNFALTRLLKDFRPRKGALGSQLLVATITEAIGIADELEVESSKSRELSAWVKPDRKSEVYKDWDSRISRCHQNMISLDGASQAIPGGVGTRGVSLVPPQQTPEEKIANSNYKQSIAEQTVKSATTKLNSTQQTYTATLETYRKTSESLREVSENLAKARQEIEGLKADKLSLEEIKKVLISCIGYLIELKDRIRKLVVFFDNLSSMIELCVTKQVLPFKKEIEIYNQVNKDKAQLYEDYYRDIIFRMVLQILANFSLYKDVATMYLEVDRKVIQEGLVVVDRLSMVNRNKPSVSDEEFFNTQRDILSTYNKNAEDTVHAVVKTAQDKIIADMQTRIQGIERTLEQFPAQLRPDPVAIEAAQAGAALTTATAEAAAAQPTGMEVARRSRYRAFSDDD